MRNGRMQVLVLAVLLMVLGTSIDAAELVNMEFRRAPLVEVLQILGQLGGYNVLVDPSVQGEVSFALKDLPIQEALDLVTRTTGYRYQLIGNTLVFASAERLKSEFGTEGVRFVTIENVSADAAQNLVRLVVPTVRSFVDTELNLVVLYGLESDLKVAEQVLKEYDRQARSTGTVVLEKATGELPSAENEPLELFSQPITYAEGERILGLVRRFWPEREFAFNPETGLLTARLTAEEWDVVRSVVGKNDLPGFVLKGILRSAERALALVEYRGTVYSLGLGETLDGWELSDVAQGAAQFSRDGLSFTVQMGR